METKDGRQHSIEAEQPKSLHLVTYSDVRDISADLLDDARRVETENCREVGDDPAQRLDLPVDGVERSGVNLDEDFARARLLDATLLEAKFALGFEEVESFLSRRAGYGGDARREERADWSGIREACTTIMCHSRSSDGYWPPHLLDKQRGHASQDATSRLRLMIYTS